MRSHTPTSIVKAPRHQVPFTSRCTAKRGDNGHRRGSIICHFLIHLLLYTVLFPRSGGWTEPVIDSVWNFFEAQISGGQKTIKKTFYVRCATDLFFLQLKGKIKNWNLAILNIKQLVFSICGWEIHRMCPNFFVLNKKVF